MKRYYILFFIVLGIRNSYCQSTLTKDSVEKLLTTSPAFSIYKDNYFIVGTTLQEPPSKYNSDVKFQVSFKQRLTNKHGWLGFFPYLTYSQKSFWNIFVSSSPFAESNYNPALIFTRPTYKNGKFNGAFLISLEHESNGRDSTESRSWNIIAGSYGKLFTSSISASLKLWIPLGLHDNPDLMEYIGYGQASLYWIIKENKLTADMVVRKGASWDWKGSIEVNIAYRPFKSHNQYIMLQWFNGYTESLIDYQEKHNMLRIGLVLKPTLYRFY